jgi:TonB family protein
MGRLAEQDIGDAPWKIWARRGGGAVLLIAVGVGVVLVARELSGSASPRQKQMAHIRIVPDTPPPPPPPPKEEKRPEPPKDAKEVKVEQPKPAPPTEQLKMEGQASDKGMEGLIGGKVTQEYKGGPLGRGNGWYGAIIEREIQRLLTRDGRMRGAEYRVVVKLWLAPDGRIQRFEITQSSGSAATDDAIRQTLTDMPPLRDRPPEDLPQPISLRITARS